MNALSAVLLVTLIACGQSSDDETEIKCLRDFHGERDMEWGDHLAVQADNIAKTRLAIIQSRRSKREVEVELEEIILETGTSSEQLDFQFGS